MREDMSGYAVGMDIFRPGTVEFLRRATKPAYDEGYTGYTLLRNMTTYATAGLLNIYKRVVHR